MDGSEGIEGSKLGPFAAEHIAIGAGEKKTLAFVTGQFARALDLASATIIASLFWGLLG